MSHRRAEAVLDLGLLLGLGAMLALGGCAPSVQTGTRPVQTAAWVVRHEIEHVQGPSRVCTEGKSAGLDTLVVQVRGRGDAYYTSNLAPRAEALKEAGDGFDPLARLLAACDETRVLAWMNVFFLWGGEDPPADPSHAVRSRPEWLLRDADGRSLMEYTAVDRALGWVEGVYADPSSPGYREHFGELVREVAEGHPVAGVHLDFVRFPGPGYGQSGPLGDLFADAWGLDPRWIPEGLRVPDLERWLSGAAPVHDRVLATAALLWAELRASQVTALVRTCRRALDAVRPGLELSAAVFPDAGSAFLEKGQDWRTWASRGLVNALYPMAYFGGPERVESQLGSIVGLVRGPAPEVRLWAGLGGYIKEPEEIAVEARAARRLGYDGICLFDAGTIMERPGGLRAYAAAARGPRVGSTPPKTDRLLSAPRTPGGRRLAAILERASGGRPPSVAEAGQALDDRWAEFSYAVEAAFPAALSGLRADNLPVPPWVELRGVFRYVHPDDGEARRLDQKRTCEQARKRILSGESFDVLARELSQGGTRNHGGVLGRRFLRPGDPMDEILRDLAPGDVSPVIEVSNGYWVYRVEAKGEGAFLPLGQVPWPVRRILMREALAEEMGGAPSVAGSRLHGLPPGGEG